MKKGSTTSLVGNIQKSMHIRSRKSFNLLSLFCLDITEAKLVLKPPKEFWDKISITRLSTFGFILPEMLTLNMYCVSDTHTHTYIPKQMRNIAVFLKFIPNNVILPRSCYFDFQIILCLLH